MDVRCWWDRLVSIGPDFGYFPNPSKTCLIVKNSFMMLQFLFFRTLAFVSLSTVVLNSRDRYEKLWLPEFSHF